MPAATMAIWRSPSPSPRSCRAIRAELSGNVKFVFQPAEEGPGGAKPMIEEGVLKDPKPDRALGLHLWNVLPVGIVGIRPAPPLPAWMPSTSPSREKEDTAPHPHQTVDAIVASAQVITALQTMVSREVDPIKPAVLSIGTIQGGHAYNIIANEVKMTGTVRAFDLELRKTLPERIERIIKGDHLGPCGPNTISNIASAIRRWSTMRRSATG